LRGHVKYFNKQTSKYSFNRASLLPRGERGIKDNLNLKRSFDNVQKF
jgi:hypothetical protein